MWAGWITGHTLKLRSKMPGASPNPFIISVDGGPPFTPTFYTPFSDSTATVFSGLADRRHYVEIRVNIVGGYSAASAFFTAGTVFTVTGGNPGLDYSIGTSWMLTDASFPGVLASATRARNATGGLNGGNVVPAINEVTNTQDGGTPANYLRGQAFKINVTAKEVWVWSGETVTHYSVDGAAPVRVNFNTDRPLLSVHQQITGSRSWKRLIIDLDDTLPHDIYIFPGYVAGETTYSCQGVALNPGGIFNTVSTTKRVVAFGDSITEGNSATAGQSSSAQYIYATSAKLGALGITRGKGGITAATLDTDTASIISALGFVPDVVEIEIGRNDGATSSAAFIISYTNIFNAHLSNGTNKVICRGVSLGGLVVGSPPARDADISTAVAARQATLTGTQALVYIPTTAWTQPATSDGTHPTEAGYTTITGNAFTDYDATGFFIPSNTAAPTISGTTTGGTLLAGNAGTWTNSPSFTYQWYRSAFSNGASPTTIVGQTAIDYTTTAGAPDQGNYIFLKVTGTTAAGTRTVSTNVLGPIS